MSSSTSPLARKLKPIPKGAGFKWSLRDEMALLLRIPLHRADKVIRAVIDVLREAVLKGETVHIEGLGTFYPKAFRPQTMPARFEGKVNGVYKINYNVKQHLPYRLNVAFKPDPSLLKALNP